MSLTKEFHAPHSARPLRRSSDAVGVTDTHHPRRQGWRRRPVGRPTEPIRDRAADPPRSHLQPGVTPSAGIGSGALGRTPKPGLRTHTDRAPDPRRRPARPVGERRTAGYHLDHRQPRGGHLGDPGPKAGRTVGWRPARFRTADRPRGPCALLPPPNHEPALEAWPTNGARAPALYERSGSGPARHRLYRFLLR